MSASRTLVTPIRHGTSLRFYCGGKSVCVVQIRLEEHCWNNIYPRTAELTAGNLCVSFPELGALLRIRQRKSGPSTSILNGDYKRSHTRKQMNREIAKGSLPSADNGSYLKLDDQPELGTVRVTREVKIDSREILVKGAGEHR